MPEILKICWMGENIVGLYIAYCMYGVLFLLTAPLPPGSSWYQYTAYSESLQMLQAVYYWLGGDDSEQIQKTLS